MNMRNEVATALNDEVMAAAPDGSKEQSRHHRLKSHTEWRSKWRNNLAARANSDSLAYFLNLSRFLLSVIFTFIYIGCDRLGSPTIRWFAIIFFCLLSYYSASTMRRGFRFVKCGIKHEVVEQNHAPTPWLWEMSGAEVSLVIFSTVIFTVPSDGAAAALTVLYVTLSSSVSVIVIVIGGLAVLVYLVRKVLAGLGFFRCVCVCACLFQLVICCMWSTNVFIFHSQVLFCLHNTSPNQKRSLLSTDWLTTT
jgi:hypothetical protein